MKKLFVAILAIIAIAIVVLYEAPKEEGDFINNHYIDSIGNYEILTTVSNNNDYSSISSSTLILNDGDSLTIENTTSNDTKYAPLNP